MCTLNEVKMGLFITYLSCVVIVNSKINRISATPKYENRSANGNLRKFVDIYDDIELQWLDSVKWKAVEGQMAISGTDIPDYCHTCNCTQLNNDMYVDCAHRDLSTAFESIRSNTLVLDYSDNGIEIVSFENFVGLTHLNVLSLSFNLIIHLDDTAFNDLTNLTELYLDHNSLIVLHYCIPTGTLDHLTNLRVLTLHGNVNLIDSGSKLNGETFRSLRNLLFLSIDGFKNITFDKNFLYTNLSTLLIKGEPSRCDIDVLEDDAFDGLSKLQNLVMKQCKIKLLSPVALANLKSLVYFDISGNHLLGMKQVLGPVAKALINSKIKILKLNGVSHQTGIKLKSEDFLYISHLNLMELHMDLNSIVTPDGYGFVFSNHSTLKVLSLRRNMLYYSEWFVENVLFLNPNIEVLDCGDQFTVLSLLNITIENSEHDSEVYLNHRKLSIRKFIFTGTRKMLILPDFGRTNFVEYIDISCNYISKFTDNQLTNLFHLMFLNMSNSFIETLSYSLFKNTPSLKYLDMQNNLLGFGLNSSKAADMFAPLKNLETIILSKNRIYSLNKHIFSKCVAIKTIDLSENYLDTFDLILHTLNNVSVLNLRNNRIQTLSQTVRSYLSIIASKHLVVVNLENNKLICSCDNIEFLNWLLNTTVSVTGKDDYNCYFSNSSQSLINTNTVQALETECFKYLALIIVLTAIITLYLVLNIAVIIFRYRWHILYRYIASLRIEIGKRT
ncbi:toll-like receptor 4 [Dreissena polymorpha]|uniref:toll-like receptor 4 n=1 Tax=Dreissena polymorpha TaxID=45954 RepID=UPI0022643BF4|nr:toll-like receptor 4 [Dreissena polymorpha]